MTFPANAIAADALPPVERIELGDEHQVLVTPTPHRGGAIQHRDRRPAGRTDLEFIANWLTVQRDQVDSFRLHHRTYYCAAPWLLVVPCDSDPWRVIYAGPLQVQPISNTVSRVRVLLARALSAAS